MSVLDEVNYAMFMIQSIKEDIILRDSLKINFKSFNQEFPSFIFGTTCIVIMRSSYMLKCAIHLKVCRISKGCRRSKA